MFKTDGARGPFFFSSFGHIHTKLIRDEKLEYKFYSLYPTLHKFFLTVF